MRRHGPVSVAHPQWLYRRRLEATAELRIELLLCDIQRRSNIMHANLAETINALEAGVAVTDGP